MVCRDSCVDRLMRIMKGAYDSVIINAGPDINVPYETTKQYKLLKEAQRLIDLGLRTDEDFRNYWEKEEYR